MLEESSKEINLIHTKDEDHTKYSSFDDEYDAEEMQVWFS